MYDILINPNSGKGKSLKALEKVEGILRSRDIDYEVHYTEYPGHALEIVGELNKKPMCNLIVMGGDGSFNEALNGITNFETINVGFISCGTGNDYIKATHIPRDVEEATNLILRDKVGYTDFIQLDDGKRALNTAGAGMDVDILVRYSTMKAFRGKAKYYASLIYTVLHLKRHAMEMEFDGVKTMKKCFIASVSNGRYIGGGMPISPESDVNDGYFNVVIVNDVKPSKVLGVLLKFLKGKHIHLKCTEHFLAKEITFRLLDDGHTQVDGEVYENKTLHCTLMHNVLRTYK